MLPVAEPLGRYATGRLGQSRVIHDNNARSLTMQPQTLRCLPQDDIELVSKDEILDFKPTRRPEQVGAGKGWQASHEMMP
jgi:hypothetical protein